MSTTYGSEQGTVYILDPPDVVAKKVRSAVTDSGSEVRRAPDKPGIANLIDILSVVRDVTPQVVEGEFDGSGYGDFKSAVADEVVTYLAPVRERYEELRPDQARLEAALAQYAIHEQECDPGPCDCGLQGLLAQLRSDSGGAP